MTDLETCRRKLDRLITERSLAVRTVQQERQALRDARQRLEDALRAQTFVQSVAEAVQRSAHAQIAGVATRCLKAVFGENAYSFEIDFVRKRGKTEAEFWFVRDGQRVDADAVGGGILDVTSFALRLACLLLSRPQRRKLLVLDEPFRFLSKNFRPAVASLLLQLSRELNVQIVMVSHAAELAIGKVIRLGGEE